VGLERGLLSLSLLRSYLEEKVAALENWEYGRGNSLNWTCDILYPKNLALISQTKGGRSVDRVRSRTKATKFFYVEYHVIS
jgi:hypothetical protein